MANFSTDAGRADQLNPQTIARVTGVLFLLTFITAIPQYIILYPSAVPVGRHAGRLDDTGEAGR